jgi:hypothetical protein
MKNSVAWDNDNSGSHKDKWTGLGIYGKDMQMWHYEILENAFEKFQKTQSGITARLKIEKYVKVQNAAYQ